MVIRELPMSYLKFLKTAIKDYKVGAITLSSRYVIKKVIGEIKPHYKYIVEYGAGNGIMTRKILEALPKDGRVVAIELNKEFIKELHTIKDPRLTIIHGDVRYIVRNLHTIALPRIDMVISGIPFSFIKPEIRKEIINRTCESLAPHGTLLLYQYTLMLIPTLKKYVRSVKVHFEPRNFPPYFIMVGQK